MKLKLFVVIFLLGQVVFAQISVEKIDEKFQYAFNLDETKLDSMKIFANEIEQDSKKVKYVLGICNSFRVKGYAAELEGKYKEASQFYMQGLKISEEQKSDEGKSGLLNDLGALNVSMKKYDKAKYFFKAALDLSQTLKVKPKPKKISSYYSNLGICYRKLNMVDSALYFYDKSLAIKKEIGDSAGIANIYTNLSGLLISQKKYNEAKKNLTYNLNFHTKKGQTDDLWDDHINMSNVERYLNNYPDAKKHLDEAMLIAKQLNSPAKISRTYENLALYFDETSDFKNAYYTYAKFHALDKELINTETNSAIEELETKYETEKKTAENKLLTQELETQKQRNILWAALSIAVALAAAAIGWALWQNRKKNKILTEKNDFIQSQNKKLAELNQEKNNLISIVSHDLGSPFSGINLWSNILGKNEKLDSEAKEAVSNIQKMAEYGQKMVQQILNIEKDETQGRSLNLEKLNIVSTIKEVIEDFGPAANGKGIQIEFNSEKETVDYLTDKQYLTRILENLISNALKYSHRDGKVLINLESDVDEIKVRIKDFEIGMTQEDQRNLFSKYGQTSSKPTENESSTGLGLHIVKRLLDELGGKITCTSELGKGSEFEVIFKK